MMHFFRPAWVCGRFHEPSKTAICYNLLTGVALEFEDDSAIIVSHILKCQRNAEINYEDMKNGLAVKEDDLISFLILLQNNGILSDSPITDELIRIKREELYLFRKNQSQHLNTPYDINLVGNAEKAYQARTKCQVYSMMFELTYRCSEMCLHCYNPGASRNDTEMSTRAKRKELNLSEYKRIIDNLYEEGLARVWLSGGDPFSKSIVWDIIDYLYKKGIATDIYTNGQNIKEEERLASYFPCSVGISIYSQNPEIHDSITRIPGSLYKSLKELEILAKYAIPLQIKCCIMRQNVKHYRGVIDIADKYSAALQLQCNIFDSADGDSCVSKHLRLNEEELEIVFRDKNVAMYVGEDVPNYGATEHAMTDITCGAGFQNFCMTPEGELVLCPSFHSSIGNLSNKKFSDLVECDELKWWRSLTIKDFKECNIHPYCKFCVLCPGLNFAKNGSPIIPSDDNCYFAKIRFKVYEMLKRGEDPLRGRTIDEALSELPEHYDIIVRKEQGSNYYIKRING